MSAIILKRRTKTQPTTAAHKQQGADKNEQVNVGEPISPVSNEIITDEDEAKEEQISTSEEQSLMNENEDDGMNTAEELAENEEEPVNEESVNEEPINEEPINEEPVEYNNEELQIIEVEEKPSISR